MDGPRFDALTRVLASLSSRRAVTHALAGGAFAALGLAFGDGADAKRKKKRLDVNRFGCVNLGGKCRGNDAHCCSGVCEGKRPKKGRRDRSRCAAHDTGGCLPGQDSCISETFPCGTNGACFQTTGNAGYCSASAGLCADCITDTDCQRVIGAGAACVICSGECPQTGGRGCFLPET